MNIISKQNNKTKFTRMCISEAILKLLKANPLDKISVTNIIKKAGIARMTFYRYYDSSHAALKDYLQIIISEYIEECGKVQDIADYLQYKHILFSLNFFDKYADFFLTLTRNNLHGILLDGMNDFMLKHVKDSVDCSVYTLYSYSGGLLNTFIKWEEDGKKESVEAIAETIYNLFSGTEKTPKISYAT